MTEEKSESAFESFMGWVFVIIFGFLGMYALLGIGTYALGHGLDKLLDAIREHESFRAIYCRATQ